jgi:hypothetical protein
MVFRFVRVASIASICCDELPAGAIQFMLPMGAICLVVWALFGLCGVHCVEMGEVLVGVDG